MWVLMHNGVKCCMPRFFIDTRASVSDRLTLVGDDARHIALSLRMAKGQKVTVSGADGREYECELTDIKPDRVELAVLSEAVNESEPPCEVTLFVALPKGDKLDLIIQKATELGAGKIVPFVSERCVVRPDEASKEKKRARRRKIAEEAAKQCGRGRVPDVCHPMTYVDAIAEAARADVPLFLYEAEGTEPLLPVLRGGLKKGATVSVVIGSEGGFSPREATAARDAGMKLCGLGKRILRCETAPMYVLSAIAYESELNPDFK